MTETVPELEEIISETQADRKLRAQILQLIRVSINLRRMGYTGQLILHLAGGIAGEHELPQLHKRESWRSKAVS